MREIGGGDGSASEEENEIGVRKTGRVPHVSELCTEVGSPY